MKVAIVTIAYDNDLEFLKYNIRSIKKYCHGYTRHCVILDNDQSCDKTKRYLDGINYPYVVDDLAHEIEHGYIRQQYMKLRCDLHTQDCDYVCHVDSDSIFTKHNDPTVFFIDNKPVIVISSYDTLIQNRREHNDHHSIENWRNSTSDAVGFFVDYEFMAQMPLVYPVKIFKKVRDHLEQYHEKTLYNQLKTINTFSEYNVIGAYAYKHMHTDFYWVDRFNTENLDQYLYNDFFGHYSSRNVPYQSHRYVDISQHDNIISKHFTD